jgi:molybdopterin/thiamine biosynthesis adenylyltransferase
MREDQIRRYARHVLLPEVGGVGQKRLLAASVDVDDASGPAGAAIVYLAAAGVGTIVVRDTRPVAREDVGALFEVGDVGRPRDEAAAERVRALNPDTVVTREGRGAFACRPARGGAGPDRVASGAAEAARVIREIVAPEGGAT